MSWATGAGAGPREEFAEQFLDCALRTLRIVKAFDDADFIVSPAVEGAEVAWTAGQHIEHIVKSYNFTRGLVAGEGNLVELFNPNYDVSTSKAAQASMIDLVKATYAAAQSADATAWDEQVEPWGPEFRMSRGRFAYLMCEHETHHRGQLHVYLRLAGKVPPLLYASVEPLKAEVLG